MSPRYAVKGHRPGQTYYTALGFIHTHPVDGGATLTDEMRAALEECGNELVEVSPTPPDDQRISLDLRAQEHIAANRLAAAEHNATENRVPPKTSVFGKQPRIRRKASQ